MKKVVGVLRGGTWGNYEKSLHEGGKIISHVFENLFDKWKPVDILVDKEGKWHFSGLPIEPVQLMNKVDVVWNMIHPSYSKTLEDMAVPVVGMNHFSKILDSREMLKEHMKKIGINMPRTYMISAYQKDFDGTLEEFAINKSKKVFEKFASPWIVKSLTEDLNVAIHVAKTFPELIDAIVDCTKHGKSILVEEFIFGKNVSVHSVSKFRGEDIYHFPPIEKKNDVVFSPGRFSLHEKEKIIESTKKIFSHVNAKQYLKLDFVLHKSGVIYLKQIDFSPNLDENSCFHKSCESVGTKAHSAIDHILEEALK